MLTRLAKEGELTASGVAYAVIMMPVFEFVIVLLGNILENNQESALFVHFFTATGQALLYACLSVCLSVFLSIYFIF